MGGHIRAEGSRRASRLAGMAMALREKEAEGRNPEDRLHCSDPTSAVPAWDRFRTLGVLSLLYSVERTHGPRQYERMSGHAVHRPGLTPLPGGG